MGGPIGDEGHRLISKEGVIFGPFIGAKRAFVNDEWAFFWVSIVWGYERSGDVGVEVAVRAGWVAKEGEVWSEWGRVLGHASGPSIHQCWWQESHL